MHIYVAINYVSMSYRFWAGLGVVQGQWNRYHSKTWVGLPICNPWQLWSYLQPFRHNTPTLLTPDTARRH